MTPPVAMAENAARQVIAYVRILGVAKPALSVCLDYTAMIVLLNAVQRNVLMVSVTQMETVARRRVRTGARLLLGPQLVANAFALVHGLERSARSANLDFTVVTVRSNAD